MMEVIVVKYVQLVCVAMFMSGNANCATLLSRSEEMNNLKVSACAASCLKTEASYSLTECYQQCSTANHSEPLPDVTTVHQTLNATFRLYCRDSKRLLIEVDNDGHVQNEKFIYVLNIQETGASYVDRLSLISNEPTIEIRNLEPSVLYDISATIVSSSNEVHLLGTKVFSTLRTDYIPEDVTEIWEEEYEPIDGNADSLNAVIGWKPARDQTCLYEVVIHGIGSDTDMFPIEKLDKNLYYHMFQNIPYNSEYRVAVMGINTEFNERPKLESNAVWMKFRSPSCRDFNDTKRVCGPEPIENLTANFEFVDGVSFTANITWSRPKHLPERYQIRITDITPVARPKTFYQFTVQSHETSVLLKNITITGPQAFVEISSCFNNKTERNALNRPVFHKRALESSPARKEGLSVVFYLFVGIVAVGLAGLLLIYMNQILDNFSRRQRESVNPDLIQSITNRSMKLAIDDHTKDALMEIERDNIELTGKTLGEGAFGLVKHAVLIRNGGKTEVAVKMLKTSPDIDDIRQFSQEISVMKSVGKHKNIVSIIGHYTEDINDLMLVTEYCDLGNLLNFLINESKRQLDSHDKKASVAPAIVQQKYPDSLYNFDDGRKETLSKKVGCEPQSVSNPMYDDLNNNSHNERLAVEMTATNALYLELSDNDPKSVVIDIEKSEEARQDSLTSDNLIEFARQVSEGMDFLARKKVVHRDLAARNILVCSDRTVKIADFGLSRDIYQDKIYRKKGQGKLPIKWLAIESMTHNEYTSQSDVWSFGILLYEIVTLGESPYPSMGVDSLLKFLESGYRMEKPAHCHQSLYEVMLECWRAVPSQRPSFDELSSKLKLAALDNEELIDLSRLCRNKCTREANYLKPIA